MIPKTFSQLGYGGFLLITLLILSAFCADALRLKMMVRATQRELPYWTAFLCALGGGFLTNISPFFLGAGLLYSVIFMLRGLSTPIAVSLVIAGSFFNHMVHFGLGLAILLFHQDLPPTLSTMRWYLLFIYLAIFLLFSLSLLFKRQVETLFKSRGNLGSIIIQGLQGFTCLWRLDTKNLLLLLTASILYFLSFYGVAVQIFRILIPESPFLLVYPLQLISYLFSLPLPTPGATGGVELAALTSFSLLAPLSQAGQVVLIWRLIIYYTPIFLGGPALLILSMREGIRREDLNRNLFKVREERV